jgi:hypothetical protein
MDDNFSIKNKRQNFRTFGLVVITVFYLLMVVLFDFEFSSVYIKKILKLIKRVQLALNY